jgi:hypothetical protein
VAEIGLDRPSVVAVVGELEPAGVTQHVGMNKKREFRSHARPGHHAQIGAMFPSDGFRQISRCPWTFPNLETALPGMLSAGPAERAIRNSGMERAREAVAKAIALYRTPSGEYLLNNKFRYLVARA